MDSLDNSFGLTLSTGNVSSERAWAELVRSLGFADGQANEMDAIAERLEAQPATAARAFGTLLDNLSGPADSAASLASTLVRTAGLSRMTVVLQKMEVLERKRALQAAAAALTPAALVTLTEATGRTLSLPLSQPLLELVQKLAREAETLPASSRATADQSFRGLVDHLVERWSESQVNAGTSTFADMFGEDHRAKPSVAPEAMRVIALSLETGAVGTVVWGSVKEQSRSERGVRDLITMITRAPDTRAAEMIGEQLVTPARLLALLHEEPVDFDAVDMLVRRLGSMATKPLLDELVEATNRATRRAIMDRLVGIGPEIGNLVQERLNDKRWYVVRNMISLLRECGCEIDHSLLDRFATHDDARVRREMLQLRMENPALRTGALVSALMDKDKSVLRAALQAARSDFPPTAVASLAKRVLDSDFPPEFRVMALYLLGKSGNVAALDALLAYASGGKTLLGKVKLANKSTEMLAALSGLARSWSNERRARELLDVAEKSRDEQILNALNSVASGD